MNTIQGAADSKDLTKVLSSFFIDNGGTLNLLAGIDEREMEAVYALAYRHYNQAHWNDALRLFTVLCLYDHLDRRFHVGRAASLQMLKRHEEALHVWGFALLMDMTDPQASFHIAECLIALGRREDARTALEAVVSAAEELPEQADIGRRAQALAALLQPAKEAA